MDHSPPAPSKCAATGVLEAQSWCSQGAGFPALYQTADSQLRLGDLYRTIGKTDQAIEYYFQAHKLGSEEAQVQLAYTFYKRGNKELAACFAYQHSSPRAKQILAKCQCRPEKPLSQDGNLLLSVLGESNEAAKSHPYYWFFSEPVEAI